VQPLAGEGLPVLPLSKPVLAARCITCIANETPHGWWWLGGAVAVLSLAVAAWLVRQDRASRNSLSAPADPA
jgi:hypothetical protein